MLISCIALFFLIIIAQALIAIGQNGLSAQAGSRDSLNEPTVLRKRLQRLTANFQENLVMFGLIVFIAHATGVSNDQTALGARLFFYARVAHAVVYAFGWPWIRPLCWFVSFLGLAIIILQLF
jgi:uncharacterized MAPEG superfamily protein